MDSTCDPRFDGVRRTFAENFELFAEVGAAVAISLDGELVVDLWGGHTDEARSRPWERDTIVSVASTTKGPVGLCANILVDRGSLDVDVPVATYWPEFAQNGKETLPVRYLLDHRSGLLAVEAATSPDVLLDWDAVVTSLAAQAPAFKPGTMHGYHAITYGFLVGEVVRRVCGKTIGTFLRDEVTTPLGATFYIGTPAEADRFCADSVAGPDLTGLATMMPSDPVAFRRVEFPSGNGHGNARGLATIYGTLATETDDAPRIIRRRTLQDATSYEITGPWFGRVDGGFAATRFACGFVLNSSVSHMGPNPKAFGYSGFGGSIAFADLEAGVGFAYTPNAQLTLDAGMQTRSGRLVDAFYASL